MILLNLAEPEWISVDCNGPWVLDVLCEVKDETNSQVSSDSSFQLLHVCSKRFVFLRKMCYIFIRKVDLPQMHNKNCPEGSRILQMHSGIELFQTLFDAVGGPFPPILSPDLQFVFSYDRYLNIYKYKKHALDINKIKGVYVCKNEVRPVPIGNNLFKCMENTHVLLDQVCDGKIDCPGQYALDELECQCEKIIKSRCKWISKNNTRKLCSPFYYMSFDGTCQLYQFNKELRTMPNKELKTFVCDNGIPINSAFVNDLVPDCGPNAEDEFHLQALFNTSFTGTFSCSSKSEIPCIQGHSKCFNISQICVYSVNKYGHLIPCRTGGHLENCKTFECNMMYKCPGYYCIPWQYVCDGKWDCPSGLDELDKCSFGRRCSMMYKCKNSVICIHLGSTCDSLYDCPRGDDEMYCGSRDLHCPSNCKCLLVTLLCLDTQITNEFFLLNISYDVAFLENTIISYGALSNLLKKKFSNVRLLTIKKCNLTKVCFSRSLLKALSIDFSYNLATTLYDTCFYNMFEIMWINLDGNVISTIQSNAFSNLFSLKYLSLLDNKLFKVAKHFLINSQKVILLALETVHQAEVDKNAFISLNPMFLFTKDFRLFCAITHHTKSNIHIPWYTSCSSFFFIKTLKFLTICFSVLILLLNVTLLFIKISTTKEKQNLSSSFATLVVALHVPDTIWGWGLYLSNLLISDIQYGDSFIWHEEEWKISSFCYLNNFIALTFHLLSPLTIGLLILARCMVVLYPLNSKFRQRKLNLKLILGINILVETSSALITIVLRFFRIPLPFRLCTLSIDPSLITGFLTTIYSWVIAFYQGFILGSIIIMYSKLVLSLTHSQRQLERGKGRDTSFKPLITQIVILTLSCILCWVPVNVMLISIQFMDTYSIEMVIWVTVFAGSINSVVYPLMFLYQFV